MERLEQEHTRLGSPQPPEGRRTAVMTRNSNQTTTNSKGGQRTGWYSVPAIARAAARAARGRRAQTLLALALFLAGSAVIPVHGNGGGSPLPKTTPIIEWDLPSSLGGGDARPGAITVD